MKNTLKIELQNHYRIVDRNIDLLIKKLKNDITQKFYVDLLDLTISSIKKIQELDDVEFNKQARINAITIALQAKKLKVNDDSQKNAIINQLKLVKGYIHSHPFKVYQVDYDGFIVGYVAPFRSDLKTKESAENAKDFIWEHHKTPINDKDGVWTLEYRYCLQARECKILNGHPFFMKLTKKGYLSAYDGKHIKLLEQLNLVTNDGGLMRLSHKPITSRTNLEVLPIEVYPTSLSFEV